MISELTMAMALFCDWLQSLSERKSLTTCEALHADSCQVDRFRVQVVSRESRGFVRQGGRRADCASKFSGQFRGDETRARVTALTCYVWVHSDTQIRLGCPHLNLLGRVVTEPLVRLAHLAVTRSPRVPLRLELGTLGDECQDPEGHDAIRRLMSIRRPLCPLEVNCRDQLCC
jgi:hypothetical protein